MGYAIACGHETTAEVAEEVLKSGGNAIDAAIACFASSWIAEPCMSGPGGGGFAVVYINGRFHALDFFAQTPANKRALKDSEYTPVTVDFGSAKEVFYTGLGSCAIPGAIAGIYKLQDLGGSIPMKELLAPAMHHASNGVKLDSFQHDDLTLLRDIVKQDARGRELFFDQGTIIPVGTNVTMPYMADFIDYLAREGQRAFYEGEVAARITEAALERGGHISLQDLKNYQASHSRPITQVLGNARIYTHGTPSKGGHMLMYLLRHLEQFDSYDPDHLFGAIHNIQTLHDEGFFDHLMDNTGGVKPGGTSHISIVDKDQNAVSLSMSLGEGSGYYIKDTDIHLNNMLGEESLLPGGIHSWKENARLASLMSPTLFLNEGSGQVTSLGSGGASRIPFMIAQVIYHYVRGGLSIPEAVEYDRIHYSEKIWQLEPGILRPDHIPLNQCNHWDRQSLYFGGVHCASGSKTGFEAKGDGRRLGVGLVS